MTVTEIIFPNIKDEARQAASEGLHALFKTVSKGAPGLEAVYRGTLLETQGSSADAVAARTPDLLIISWTELSAFESFLQTDNFAKLKEGLGPFSAGPPELKLFEAIAIATPFKLFLAKSPVIQVFIVSTEGGISVADQAWAQYTEAVSDAAREKNEAIPSFYHAFDTKYNEGVFLGCIGWDSVKASKEASIETTVKHAMKSMSSASKKEELSLYTLQLELMVEAK